MINVQRYQPNKPREFVSVSLGFFMLINLEISKIFCIFIEIITDFFMSTFFFNIYIDRVINKIDTYETM